MPGSPSTLGVRYITDDGIKHLKEKYKYVGTDHSLIARYILQPFWRWVVELLPLWIAPNLVTLLGFAFIIIGYAPTIYYCSDLDCAAAQTPSWVFINAAVCLFVYQTMDAIDGKQARRTGSSSPLGELFDHGCDAMSTTLLTLTTAAMLSTQSSWLSFYMMTIMMVGFYCAQWEEYHTGRLDLGYFSVTEGQVISIALHLLTAWKGCTFWAQETTLFGISLRYGVITAHLASMGVYYNILMNVSTMISLVGKGPSEEKDVHSIPVTIVGGAKRLIPLALHLGGAIAWSFISRIDVVHHMPHQFLMSVGLIAAGLVSRMVVYRVTAMDYGPEQPIAFAMPLACVMVYYDVVPEAYIVWTVCLFSIMGYLAFAICIIQELTYHLNIHCLSIPTKKSRKD